MSRTAPSPQSSRKGMRQRIARRIIVVMTATLTASVSFSAPPGTFTPTGNMTTTRASHTATLLPNGNVLIAGGTDGSQALATAELFDPATRTFAATGNMTTARNGHTATLLANGKVLIAGGSDVSQLGGDGSQPLATAELYDPVTGTFSPTGNMITAQSGPSTRLANGKVFFAGADRGEIYDPATGTFALTGAYADPFPVSWTTATFLLDGRVLVIGFATGSFASAAELFDPASGTFKVTGPTDDSGAAGTATLLTDGTVLVVTPTFDIPPDDAELYDPGSQTFTHIGTTIGYHDFSAAVRLGDGTVLITGGQLPGGNGSSATELYLPATRIFSAAGNMIVGRDFHTATLLGDGTVLIAGGLSIWSPRQLTASAETYRPSTDVGPVGLAGSATVDSNGNWTVSGSGGDIWGTTDAFQFPHRTFGSAGSITVRVDSLQDTNAFAKAGVMIRASLDPSAAMAILDIKPDGGVEFMTRAVSGDSVHFIAGASAGFPLWLRLAWDGGNVSGSISTDPVNWTLVGTGSITLPSNPVGGLAVTSHDNSRLATAHFDSVSTGGNLLVDGDFEGYAPPALGPPGWIDDFPFRAIRAKSETNQPHSGLQNGACWATTDQDCGMYQEVNAPTTGSYTLTIFANADRPGGLVGANVNGQTANSAPVDVRGFGTYGAPYVIAFSANAGDTIRVWMYSPATPGYVVIDDVSLVADAQQ